MHVSPEHYFKALGLSFPRALKAPDRESTVADNYRLFICDWKPRPKGDSKKDT